LAGETEVLEENLPHCRSVHHKPDKRLGREPEQPRWEASDRPLELLHGLNEPKRAVRSDDRMDWLIHTSYCGAGIK
jgi:hypothetical protein